VATSRRPQNHLEAVARYSRSREHFSGCAAAIVVLLLAGVWLDWSRLALILAVLVAYGVVAGGLWWSRSRTRISPDPGPRQVPDLMYLHVRRVDDSLALLRQSLAQQMTVTGGTTNQRGGKLTARLFGVGLSSGGGRTVAQGFSALHQMTAQQRYQALHDYVGIRAIPDDSPTTLEQQTFWEFPLVDVRPVSDVEADELYAIGQLRDRGLRMWFRIDQQWRLEQFREFHGDLTVVARAVAEPLPDQLITRLQGGDDPPAWRLRPLAVLS